jgi:hypothetical protein
MTLTLTSMLLALVVAHASAQSVRVFATNRWASDVVSLHAVRGEYLVFDDDGRLDSVLVDDVSSIMGRRQDHVVGAITGMTGGALAGVLGGALFYGITGPGDHGNWGPGIGAAAIFVVSTVAGTIWGASEGVPAYNDPVLELDGLDATGKRAALERFMLDEELRRRVE